MASVPNAPASASSGGSAGVFGILLIIIGIVLAFLFVTGRLSAVWADIVGTGSSTASASTAASSSTPTPANASATPSVQSQMSTAPLQTMSTPISTSPSNLSGIFSLFNNLGSSASQPQVPAAATPTYPSSAATAIGTPTGVTGVVA